MKLNRENKLLIGLCTAAAILIAKLFSIQIINDDPSVSVGDQVVVLYNCKLSKIPIAMLDADAEWLEEEVGFSFTDVAVLRAFHDPEQLGG